VPRSAAAPALVKLLIAAAAMCPHPVTDRLARDAQQTSDLDLLVPLIDQSHSPPAKFFLSVLRQQASIPIDTLNTTTNATIYHAVVVTWVRSRGRVCGHHPCPPGGRVKIRSLA